MLYQIDMWIKTEDTCFSYINSAKNIDAHLVIIFFNYRFIKWRSIKFSNEAFLNKNKQRHNKWLSIVNATKYFGEIC